MKKILIILMITIMIFVTACSKGDTLIVEPHNDAPENEIKTEDDKDAEKEPIVAPDFELEDLEGNMVKLSSLQGKKVIINFWATWCGFCVEEMPDLMKLQEEYKDDLVVLYVNVGESKDDVIKFVEKEKITGTIVLDTKQQVAATYGVRSFPSTLALNEKGEVVTARVGMMDYEMMVTMYEMIK